MKTKSLLLAAAAAISLCGAAFAKIAVIDLEKIINLHPNTPSDKSALKEAVTTYNQELALLEKEAEAAAKAFDEVGIKLQDRAALATMSEKKKAELEAEAKAKYQAAESARRKLINKTQERNKKLLEQEAIMLQRTTKDIEGYVSEYAKANGIELVLTRTSAMLSIQQSFIWADEALDITEEIMAKMNIKEPEAEPQAMKNEE